MVLVRSAMPTAFCALAGLLAWRKEPLPGASHWIGVYLSHPHDPDPEGEQEYRRLLGLQ